MQLINNFEKKIVSHQVESCLQHLGQAEIVVFSPLLYASLYIITMLQYVYTYGNFQGTSMVLFTICVMIISTRKQFPGLSVSYLPDSTQILNMIEISAV